jgi:hypothetical protein
MYFVDVAHTKAIPVADEAQCRAGIRALTAPGGKSRQ